MEYPILKEKPPQPGLTATTLPVLGIWGAYDRALTEQPMLDTYDVMDDYSYVRFDVSSHWPMLDEPEKFNETLLRFFKKHDRP